MTATKAWHWLRKALVELLPLNGGVGRAAVVYWRRFVFLLVTWTALALLVVIGSALSGTPIRVATLVTALVALATGVRAFLENRRLSASIAEEKVLLSTLREWSGVRTAVVVEPTPFESETEHRLREIGFVVVSRATGAGEIKRAIDRHHPDLVLFKASALALVSKTLEGHGFSRTNTTIVVIDGEGQQTTPSEIGGQTTFYLSAEGASDAQVLAAIADIVGPPPMPLFWPESHIDTEELGRIDWEVLLMQDRIDLREMAEALQVTPEVLRARLRRWLVVNKLRNRIVEEGENS